MDWTQARRNLLQLATRRAPPAPWPEGGVVLPADDAQATAPADAPPTNGSALLQAASLCVASGKGGTGKSVVCASLASLFSAHGRTLLVDADMGVGNAHILQDVSPARSFVDVVEGRSTVRDVVVPCGACIDLLAAGSGVPRMADLSSFELHLIATGLEELEADYRFVLVDSAAGVSRQTVGFARACDVVLIVTTPDLTAMTDAYAFLKVLLARDPELRPLLLVNRATCEEEAEEVGERIGRVCRRFLHRAPRRIGWLPDDHAVTDCVNRRGPVALLEPHAPFAAALRRIAVEIQRELGAHHPEGLGRRLLRDVGYSARLA